MRSRERNTTWPGTANSRSGVRRGFVVSGMAHAVYRRLLTSSRTRYFDRQHVDYVRYNFAMNFALFETRSGNVPVAVRRSTWRLRGARRVAFVLQIQDTTHSPVTLVDRATHRAAAPAARRLGPALLSCSGSGQRAARQQRGHTVQLYS